ncbi:MAG: hypothetical protein ACOC16_02540 [Nanoarchaeota archaeon]
MVKFFLFILFSFLMITNVINAITEESNAQIYLKSNGFDIHEDLEFNKISYSLKVENNINYTFEMNYYYKDSIFTEKQVHVGTCSKEVFFDEEDYFKKIICDIEKLGNGQYIFDATLKRDDSNFQLNSFEKVNLFNSQIATMDFKDINNETKITINIQGNNSNIIVNQNIPKSVIKYLDENNKENLIESEKDYIIIKNNPIIAWKVDEVPAQINYTIKKRTNQEDKNKFEVEITNQKNFQALKYIILFLLLMLLFIIFKPAFKKKKNEKQ